MKTLRTTCPLDCPDACTLEVAVQDGRVTGLSGAKDSPTNGFICGKVAKFPLHQYDDLRVRTPLKRVGAKGQGEFVPCSWDEAISEITTRFREIRDAWGGEAILPYHYGGSNGLLTDSFTDRAFFSRLGASRLDKTICAVPTTAVSTGMYGKMPGVAYQDYPEAECIVVWGQNPKACSVHLVPYLHEAKKRGAFIITIDPRRNFSARETDLHLPVLPGGDLALALGVIRWCKHNGHIDSEFVNLHGHNVETLLDACESWPLDRAADASGLTVADITTFAERYVAANPAVIRCGWGVERNRNGGQALGAIFALPGLLGKFGVRGGGYTMSNSGGVRADIDGVLGGIEWNTRTVNMTQLDDALTGEMDPPVKALFIYNCNPAVTVPNQRKVMAGLSRDDLFTVVFDQIMTDTTAYADIVLPATTFLEHYDVRRAYGNYVVGGVRPIVPAEGEARSNPQVFRALGLAMGWKDGPFGWDDATAVEKVAGAMRAGGRRVSAATLLEGEVQPVTFEGGRPVQFGNVFPYTDDGKIDFCPPQLGDRPFQYEKSDESFPLALISPASGKLVTSTFGQFNLKTLTLTLHPDDARTRGVADRSMVRVYNDLGEVICEARISRLIRPGVVSMPKGAWRKSSGNGMTSTALCPSHVNVVGGAACFNDARVDIEPLKD